MTWIFAADLLIDQYWCQDKPLKISFETTAATNNVMVLNLYLYNSIQGE